MRKIIDSHMHIKWWGQKDYISCFDRYRESESLHSINICSIPLAQSNVANNILLVFHKLARPNTYIHGGVELIHIPVDNMPSHMDAVTQYRELMDLGFDGIKMLEGKPTEHKRIGKSLNHKELNKLYCEIEKDGTHLLMHVNDPDEFWDLDRAPDWAIKAGWTYTDGSFSTYEEIKRQAIKILEDYPSIKMTLAHFFFSSKEPQLLEKLFSLYPNLCVDLTPGGEMYVSFEKNYSYYKEFFKKYSDRLIFGTDRSYMCDEGYAKWQYDLVTTFLGTDKETLSFDNKILKGLGLSEEKKDQIFFANFESRVGTSPKPIDKEKFKAYIEKYSFVLTDEDKEHIKALSKKYL
ncbi:MAG: amidohydrolase family protein [Clostridia bacterium]|nr:amidohydrolase family protein [Clostridia bacterium]